MGFKGSSGAAASRSGEIQWILLLPSLSLSANQFRSKWEFRVSGWFVSTQQLTFRCGVYINIRYSLAQTWQKDLNKTNNNNIQSFSQNSVISYSLPISSRFLYLYSGGKRVISSQNPQFSSLMGSQSSVTSPTTTYGERLLFVFRDGEHSFAMRLRWKVRRGTSTISALLHCFLQDARRLPRLLEQFFLPHSRVSCCKISIGEPYFRDIPDQSALTRVSHLFHLSWNGRKASRYRPRLSVKPS